MFLIERKLLSCSRHDFNVHAAAASSNQPQEADGLPRGNNGASATKYIPYVYHGS